MNNTQRLLEAVERAIKAADWEPGDAQRSLQELRDVYEGIMKDGIVESCPAVMYHGPGHQSRSKCTRRDPHSLDDEHYAPDPTEAGFNWIGGTAYS